MASDLSRLGPLLVGALLVWVLYRRIRRNFGAQRLDRRRMAARIALLALLACLLIPWAVRSLALAAALGAGLATGAALGLWGAKQTRFLDRDGERFFVPHTYAGLAVAALLVARIGTRAWEMMHAGIGGANAAAAVRSPQTVAVIAVLIGYYVCFYARVLKKSRHPRAAGLEMGS